VSKTKPIAAATIAALAAFAAPTIAQAAVPPPVYERETRLPGESSSKCHVFFGMRDQGLVTSEDVVAYGCQGGAYVAIYSADGNVRRWSTTVREGTRPLLGAAVKIQPGDRGVVWELNGDCYGSVTLNGSERHVRTGDCR
jgi:hypothetical protein